MSHIIFLGTASAISHQHSENTHFAIVGEEELILVDAPCNPVRRMLQANLFPSKLTGLILTHFHPDHVGGVPLLLMDSWLLGRRQALEVFGLADVLERVRQNMALYEWDTWPNFYPVNFHDLPSEEMMTVLETPGFQIQGTLVCHMIPALGLRIQSRASGKVIAYSSDTEPCQQVVRLARQADFLIHEATGQANGHTSASQAGEIARQAGVGSLILIHYHASVAETLVAEAQKTFTGPVYLARDFESLEF